MTKTRSGDIDTQQRWYVVQSQEDVPWGADYEQGTNPYANQPCQGVVIGLTFLSFYRSRIASVATEYLLRKEAAPPRLHAYVPCSRCFECFPVDRPYTMSYHTYGSTGSKYCHRKNNDLNRSRMSRIAMNTITGLQNRLLCFEVRDPSSVVDLTVRPCSEAKMQQSMTELVARWLLSFTISETKWSENNPRRTLPTRTRSTHPFVTPSIGNREDLWTILATVTTILKNIFIVCIVRT